MDLPLLPKPKDIAIWKGCKIFKWQNFVSKKFVGSGSFGEVIQGSYEGKDVVIKKPINLDIEGKRGFVKEARLLETLSHDNVVKYMGFCFDPLSMMLDCVNFDMRLFGHDKEMHNLEQLLSYLDDQCNFKGFTHFQAKIALDISSGLSYLHEKGIAHRDLKPSNILVSNQHYIMLDSVKRKKHWEVNPVVCKLTDFGESRSLLLQTNSIINTKTSRVDRGTPVFTAPELRLPGKRPSFVTLEDLKVADVWSLGMVLFCVINPDQKFPYRIELLEYGDLRQWELVVNEIQMKQQSPKQSPKYEMNRKNQWHHVEKLMEKCISFYEHSRPTALSIFLELNGKNQTGTNDSMKAPGGGEQQFKVPMAPPLSRKRATAVKNHNEEDDILGPSIDQALDDICVSVPNSHRQYNECLTGKASKMTKQKPKITSDNKNECLDSQKQSKVDENIEVIPRRPEDRSNFTKAEVMNNECTTTAWKSASRSGKNLMTTPPPKKRRTETTYVDQKELNAMGSRGRSLSNVTGKSILHEEQRNVLSVYSRSGYVKRQNLFDDCVILEPTTSSKCGPVSDMIKPKLNELSSEFNDECSDVSRDVLKREKSDESIGHTDTVRSSETNAVKKDSDLLDDRCQDVSLSRQQINESVNQVTSSNTKETQKVEHDFEKSPLDSSGEPILKSAQPDKANNQSVPINAKKIDGSHNNVSQEITGSEQPEKTDQQRCYWKGRKSMPILQTGLKKRNSLQDAVRFLLDGSIPKCDGIPLRVRSNISFLIDVGSLTDWEDVKCDMNGVYDKVKRCCVWTVKMNRGELEILSKKKIPLTDENEYHLTQHSKGNKACPSLIRSIFLLQTGDGSIVNQACLLQYHIDGEEEEVHFMVGKHGNRKCGQNQSFHPTSKGLLKKMSSNLNIPSQKVYESLKDGGGGAFKADNPSMLPRSKHQIYSKKSMEKRKLDAVEELLIYIKHKEQNIVLQHSDVPSDLWILGTPDMCRNISTFVEDDILSYPFFLDPTFNIGLYEITPLVYRHLFLKSRRTGRSPIFLGPTLMHHLKDEETYKQFASVCVSKCPSLRMAKGFATDGERALSNAFSSEIPNAVHLRCFRHFEGNCKEKLSNIGINKEVAQRKMLSLVFGIKDKEEGILDAKDRDELRTRLDSTKDILNDIERDVLGDSNASPRFWNYLNSNFNMMASCMILDARRAAGMPIDDNGVPERCYTNPIESIHNVIKKKKAAYTKGDSKRKLSKVEFVKHIWESIIHEQEQQLALALAGSSDEYELADCVKYLQVDDDVWFDMKEEERHAYVDKFKSLKVKEVFMCRKIAIERIEKPIGHIEERQFQRFSRDIGEYLQKHFDYPKETATLVAKEASELLNAPSAIQMKPNLEDDQPKEYFVASHRYKSSHYTCKVYRNHVKCNCASYKYDTICKHSLAVAEKVGMLNCHLTHIEGKQPPLKLSALAEDGIDLDAAGRKGGKKRKKRYRPNTERVTLPTTQPIYNSVHHNDNAFVVRFLPVPVKCCKTCSIDFCQRQPILPFNIVLEHAEKWEYPVQGNWSEKRVSKAESKRYYHVDIKKCIKPRFPYFTREYVEVPQEIIGKLQPSHKKLLKDELGVDIW